MSHPEIRLDCRNAPGNFRLLVDHGTFISFGFCWAGVVARRSSLPVFGFFASFVRGKNPPARTAALLSSNSRKVVSCMQLLLTRGQALVGLVQGLGVVLQMPPGAGFVQMPWTPPPPSIDAVVPLPPRPSQPSFPGPQGGGREKKRGHPRQQPQRPSTADVPLTKQYHIPPPGVTYESNLTPFGAILRGELPAHVYQETTNVLALEDIRPRAPLHALIIPKRLIPSVLNLTNTKDDVALLDEMQSVAFQVLQLHQPTALATKDYMLRFHIPPYASVSHLHLHVLAPASQLKWYHRYIKYQSNTVWCTDWDATRQKLGSTNRLPSVLRPF